MVNRLIVYIVSLYLVLTPTIYAASPSSSGGGGWTNKTVTRVALSDVIEATARQQVIRNGTAVTLEAVVQETINRRAVGQVLLKRLFAGGLLISATQSLVEGVGWIMEDGVYVKYKIKEDNCVSCQKAWYGAIEINGRPVEVYKKTSEEVCLFYATGDSLKDYTYSNKTIISLERVRCTYKSKRYPELPNWNIDAETFYIQNPHYNPGPEPEKERVILTPDLMGDLAVGDYTDPVDESKNKKDKVWTDVENSYKPDVVGNDLSDKVDRKLDDSPETNNKPSTPPKPDGDGQKYPAPDQKPGGQGETENKTDPDTGTQTGTFTLPDWCIWAADQCQWHKEDKKHQEEETTFWGDVKNFFKDVKSWFDWSKEQPDLNDEQLEIEDQNITDYERNDYVTFGKTCPFSPHQVSLPLGILGDLTFEADLTFICTFGNEARPFVIGLGYLGGLIFLLIGLRNGNG